MKTDVFNSYSHLDIIFLSLPFISPHNSISKIQTPLETFSFSESRKPKMSDSESDTEITIANDLVVTKYKMAGEIANR